MFHDLDLVDRWSIDPTALSSFIRSACAGYRNTPFHSFTHGTTVAHITYFFVSQTRLGDCLDKLHQLAMLTAAVCHDIDHPGHTNAFEINSSSLLALRYNDRSVLENHHASTGWSILRNQESNIFTGLSLAELKQVRDLFVSSIIYTDMAKHMHLLDKFKDANNNNPNWAPQRPEEKKLLCNVLIHTADLSNPARQWKTATAWARLIGQEFNNQVSKEKEMKLPYAPFMETNNELEHVKGEIGFLNYVIKPWWSHMATVFPFLDFALQNVRDNQAKYEEKAAEYSDPPEE